MLKKIILLIALTAVPFAASAKSADKKRAEILEMRQEVLTRLYSEKPEARDMVKSAEGYAVFNNGGVNLIFLSAGSGKGVAHDNKTGKNTFMRMATGGVGIGLGIKDYQAVMIFHKRSAFDNFVEHGWDFSGQADAAAKVGDEGGEANVADTAVGGVTVYQMTKKGLALQATLQGTKYWKNGKLNK
ncbi:YSC84-related protein [Paremcibacter congregatus]|uniref:lipid-binding SYLF domain-containing protein n=1 Tax=Paremcibacter congregatus TaxID=2043170 RepID=UPI0030EBB8D7